MKPIEVTSRYARALYELAESQKSVEQTCDALKTFAAALTKHPRFEAIFVSPAIKRSEKRELIDRLIKQSVHPLINHFIAVLIQKNRMNLVPDIADEFESIWNGKKGVAKASLASARTITQDVLQAVVGTLEKKLHKKLIFTTRVDPKLLGGIQIRIGNSLIDGTLRTKLNELKRQLTAAKVG